MDGSDAPPPRSKGGASKEVRRLLSGSGRVRAPVMVALPPTGDVDGGDDDSRGRKLVKTALSLDSLLQESAPSQAEGGREGAEAAETDPDKAPFPSPPTAPERRPATVSSALAPLVMPLADPSADGGSSSSPRPLLSPDTASSVGLSLSPSSTLSSPSSALTLSSTQKSEARRSKFTSSRKGTEGTPGSEFRVTDVDTGGEYDIRYINSMGSDGSMIEVGYNLFPSRDELFLSTRNLDDNGLLDSPEKRKGGMERETLASPSKGKKKSSGRRERSKGMLKGWKKKMGGPQKVAKEKLPSTLLTSRETFNGTLSPMRPGAPASPPPSVSKGAPSPPRGSLSPPEKKTWPESAKTKMFHRRRRQGGGLSSMSTVPENAVPVRCSRHKAPSSVKFDPVVLTASLPNAHTGPVWCTSFSPSGGYLATGGEDGNVCLWEVAPRHNMRRGKEEGDEGGGEARQDDVNVGGDMSFDWAGTAARQSYRDEVGKGERTENDVISGGGGDQAQSPPP